MTASGKLIYGGGHLIKMTVSENRLFFGDGYFNMSVSINQFNVGLAYPRSTLLLHYCISSRV